VGALTTLATLVLAACGSTSTSTTQLASDQTLKFPFFQDYGTLDPGILDAEVDSEIAQNIFDNLWRFDDNGTIIPDIATDVPTTSNGGISSDGLTYTIHLRKDVTFSNGDKVTAKDVIYSWNRGAELQGGYSTNMGGIDGFNDVVKAAKKKPKKAAAESEKAAFQTQLETRLAANDPTLFMKGLTKVDDSTIKVKLSAAAGWSLPAWTLQASTGSIVDESVVKQNPRDWWRTPSTLIGTGAFKESAYTAKQSADFEAVSGWWGSPKPTLKKVHIDIKDPSTWSTAIAAWEQKGYDIVGYGGNSTQPVTDMLRIKNSSSESSELLLHPKVRTTWVSLNVGYPGSGGPFIDQAGPTAGAGAGQTLAYNGTISGINLDKTSGAAHDLRLAFVLAVDKAKLAQTVCHNLLCTPATGGLITKGLKGYLGDNTDPLAKFDPARAKTLLTSADPTGSKTANVKYSYNSGGLNDPVATFLQDQWQSNLGISVHLDPHPDASAFIADRLAGKFVLSRDGWQADYDHPQDWFDNLFGSVATGNTSNSTGYATRGFDATLAKADGLPLDQALPLYNQLSKELSDNAVYIPLYYSLGQFLIHSYVKGAGTDNFKDHYWNEISILQH
jgi:oligopeptide transport system substrate-binding protein